MRSAKPRNPDSLSAGNKASKTLPSLCKPESFQTHSVDLNLIKTEAEVPAWQWFACYGLHPRWNVQANFKRRFAQQKTAAWYCGLELG
jgi:hypothetical protein